MGHSHKESRSHDDQHLHAHSHAHSQMHSHTHDASKNLLLALILNISFAIIELIGGLFTNSVAILSDALHDFGDAFSLGIAWYLQKVSKRPPDDLYSYGYRRFSLLGSLVVSLVLVIGVSFMVREAFERLLDPKEANAVGMFWLSVLGIAINGFAALNVKKGKSHNERAVYLHLLEDALGWIAVFISSIFMIFFHLPFLDPLMSIAISVFILFNVFRNLRSVVKILLMEAPGHIDLESLKSAIRGIKNIRDLDDVHLWTQDGENHILTLQVIVSEKMGLKDLCVVKEKIRRLAIKRGIEHSTIEFCSEKENRAQKH